ncbi:hypothetical protein IWZ01DRAFT_434635, partial [Phyllosticta capitalensis]
LAGVRGLWHRARIEVLDLERTAQPSGAVFEGLVRRSAVAVIIKIARFEQEIRRIERETRAYQVLSQRGASDVAPRFLGHVHEGGRVICLLLEKWDGRSGGASIEDLSACEAALARFHGLSLLHGDANRYNFLVGQDGCGEVKLIDFECFREGASEQVRADEMRSYGTSCRTRLGEEEGFCLVGVTINWVGGLVAAARTVRRCRCGNSINMIERVLYGVFSACTISLSQCKGHCREMNSRSAASSFSVTLPKYYTVQLNSDSVNVSYGPFAPS